jgi:hypothetical protein
LAGLYLDLGAAKRKRLPNIQKPQRFSDIGGLISYSRIGSMF